MFEKSCGLCGKPTNDLTTISKQYPGGWKLIDVCPACTKAHDDYLAKMRENFRIQFGEK